VRGIIPRRVPRGELAVALVVRGISANATATGVHQESCMNEWITMMCQQISPGSFSINHQIKKKKERTNKYRPAGPLLRQTRHREDVKRLCKPTH